LSTTNDDWRERDRALAIIAKARREEVNIVNSLVSHMVSRSLIAELLGDEVLPKDVMSTKE
jgi:hypothetical protein